MRIYKTKWFTRFARKERITNDALIEAVTRAELGLIDADLSGGLIKQRIARPGRGRSGGFRSIIVYRAGDLAVFLYGFPKSDRENITADELESAKDIAAVWLNSPQERIDQFVKQEKAEEITYEQTSKND